MTLDLFADCSSAEYRSIGLPDAEVLLFEQFFSQAEADRYLGALATAGEIEWQQEKISRYGRQYDVPRLTAWYGNPGTTYTYSGIRLDPLPWTPSLLAIKARVEQVSEVVFNSVLLNKYRDGRDGVSWHSDDEPELGPAPIIASVSLGQARRFQMKHRREPDIKRELELGHGSLLLMRGATQKNWLHQVPKSASKKIPLGVRVNLTFRSVRAHCIPREADYGAAAGVGGYRLQSHE